MVQSSPSLSDGCGIGQHADGPLYLRQVSSWDHGRRLVVDTHFETSRTPVYELDGPLGLDGGDGCVHILGHHVPAVQHAAGHVLAVTGVTLHHLVGGLEAGVGDLRNAQLFVVGLLRRDDRGVCDQREVDTGVGDQVGLELRQVHIQGSVESERGRDRRDDLSDQTVQVGVGGSLYVQVPAANIVDGFVVYHEGTVRVL